MGPGDREFLIHPSFGAAVKTALQPSAVSEAASRTLAKKPFDWLLDEQYSNLQVSILWSISSVLMWTMHAINIKHYKIEKALIED